MIEINKEKLNEVLIAFYRTTGARVGIFDNDRKPILCYPEKFCKLCESLRKNRHIDLRCQNSDERAFAECKRTRKIYTYECYMGLFESVAPIISDEKVIAYVMIGQVVCLSSKNEIMAHAKKYFSDYSHIQSEVYKAKSISINILESAIYLMNICIEHLFTTATISTEKIDIMLKIDKFILENLKHQITADDVCDKFNFSRTTLHYMLKKKYDSNFSSRVNFLRIDKAKKMLLDKKPIEDICYEIGISEKNYFYKIFKKITGQTTTEYLRENIHI